MYTFRVTFESRINGKKKSVKVEALGMEPALTNGLMEFHRKNSMFDWDLVKCEMISGRFKK